ncbi:MAG: hypothetical protein HUU32_22990 [Calditrichaceae bacterium]|nr:hypothetical protein [Calditrichia bacterium]NUQ44263.1 hypothetical protein [Calditrichaceae bacterium]
MDDYVLIIESDTAVLRRLREILTREGFNIMTAANWETARKISEKIGVKLILCESALIKFPDYEC